MNRVGLIILCIAFAFVQAHATDPFKAVYYNNAAPLSWSENNQTKGILIDILDEAIKNRMGIPITHTSYPWARAQHLVESQKADAFVTVPTDTRRKYTNISTETVVQTNVHIYTWDGNPKIEKLEKVKIYADLKPFTMIDYLGNGRSKRDLKGMNVHWVAKIESILPILTAKRVDAWVVNSTFAEYSIKRLGYTGKIVRMPNKLSSAAFHLCIEKLSPYNDILPKFDTTIRSMHEDGTIQKILSKYK